MDDFCLKLTRLEELKQKTSRAAPLRRLLQQTVMQRGGVFQVSAEGLCIYYQPAEVKEFAPLNEVSAMESLANMQDLRNKTCDEVMEIVTAHAARGGGGSVKECAFSEGAVRDSLVTTLFQCIQDQLAREAPIVKERKRLARETSKMREEVIGQLGQEMRVVETATSYVVLYMTGGDFGAPQPDGIRSAIRDAIEAVLLDVSAEAEAAGTIQAMFFSRRNTVPCKERPLRMKSHVIMKD